MPSYQEISPDKLNRLIGSPNAPRLVDVRTQEDFDLDPRLIPGSVRRDHASVRDWASSTSSPTVVICQKGHKLSQGTAAFLRQSGTQSETLEGGFEGWLKSGGIAVPEDRIPHRDTKGRTTWVTRSRPKIDRIACPWLIRRFVDPDAVFLFVAPAEVSAVAERFGAVAFDIEGCHWSHRGELCTFDVMVEEFGLSTDPLQHLATIVRAADTARLDLAPEAHGLLAASLGLSRMYSDDLEQLEAGMLLYDAFYRWARDATGETHNWPAWKRGA